mgnify:CR=1 FL=1
MGYLGGHAVHPIKQGLSWPRARRAHARVCTSLLASPSTCLLPLPSSVWLPPLQGWVSVCAQGAPCPQAGPLQRPFCLPGVRVPQISGLPAHLPMSGLRKALPGHTPPPQAPPRDPQVTLQPHWAVCFTPPSGCGLVPAPGAWAP